MRTARALAALSALLAALPLALPPAGSIGTAVAVGTGPGGYFEDGGVDPVSCEGTFAVEVHPNVVGGLASGPALLDGHDVRWQLANAQGGSACRLRVGWWLGVAGSAEEGFTASAEGDCTVTTLTVGALGAATPYEWREELKPECHGSGPDVRVHHAVLDFTRVT